MKFCIILNRNFNASELTLQHTNLLTSIVNTTLTFHSGLSLLCSDRSRERMLCTPSPLESYHSSVHEETGGHQQAPTDGFLTGQEPKI